MSWPLILTGLVWPFVIAAVGVVLVAVGVDDRALPYALLAAAAPGLLAAAHGVVPVRRRSLAGWGQAVQLWSLVLCLYVVVLGLAVMGYLAGLVVAIGPLDL